VTFEFEVAFHKFSLFMVYITTTVFLKLELSVATGPGIWVSGIGA